MLTSFLIRQCYYLLNYRGKGTEKLEPAYAFRSTENQLSKFNLPHQKQRQKGDKRPFLSHYHKRSNGRAAHAETQPCTHTHTRTHIYRNKFYLINSAAASKFNFKIPFPRRSHLVSHFLSLEFEGTACKSATSTDPFQETRWKINPEIKMVDGDVKGHRNSDTRGKPLTRCCPRPSHRVTVVADSGVVTVPTISNVFHGRSDALCFSIPGLSRPLTEAPLIVRPCIVMISSSAPPRRFVFTSRLVARTITI